MTRRLSTFLPIWMLISLAVTACGTTSAWGPSDDAGVARDAGPQPDAGLPDSGRLDAGDVDAGSIDAGEGPADAGPIDAGPSDDAGFTDAGAHDTGTRHSDAGACQDNAECSGAEYCAGMGCGTSGTCEPLPGTCSNVVDLVCGCDGNTYINACYAEQAGTRVSTTGSCTTPDGGSSDGGVTRDAGAPLDGGRACTSNLTCQTSTMPDVLWCAGTGCGTPGDCEPVPTSCPGIFEPVCGCDGQTYTNSCEAEMARVRVSTTGSCPVPDAGASDGGIACGAMTCGVAELCCEATSMCYADGCTDCCTTPMDGGTPDAGSGDGGACIPESDSQLCASAGVVCGQFSGLDNCGVDRFVHCDDCGAGSCCETSSTCCVPGSIDCCFIEPQPDGGRDCTRDSECPSPQYCAGTGCGSAGTCLTKPVDCPDAGEWVCGCNGTSYGNTCLAEAAGVRADYSGACSGVDAGASCTTNAECPSSTVMSTDYCAGSGCGTPGFCEVKPQECPTIVMPVCACNGKTYSNACLAEAAGERVASDGGCAADAGSGDAGGSSDAGPTDAGAVSCGASTHLCLPGQLCCPFASACYWPDAGFLCLPP